MSFQDHIALEQVGTGEYNLTIHDKYWIVAGPNGGYLAALFANAGNLHLNSPERQLRSLTTHFLSPPKLGEARITVKTERSGRLVVADAVIVCMVLQRGAATGFVLP